ncbi:DUF3108 domain-containing protein [Flavicella sp.]|nr:DUF3108 domain-containing protein [Flavicella sp.]
MKKRSFFLMLICSMTVFSQRDKEAFQSGEWLKYRIHYGFVNAGYATLKVDEATDEQNELFHFVGKGWTVGITNLFFKVRDTYESFVDKESRHPKHFKRRVNEGGYKIRRDIYFYPEKKIAKVEDHKEKTIQEVTISKVQDLLSSFYLLRNSDVEQLQIGESLHLDLFFDSETYPFKLIYLGKEVISTKFGKVACYKMRPSVQSGRVFKEKESLTLWISSDKNKIPIRIKASLKVGSIKVDLKQYKGLSHPFPIIL